MRLRKPTAFRLLLAAWCSLCLACSAGVVLAESQAAQSGGSGPDGAVVATLLLVLFLTLVFLPFVPAVVEVFYPLDEYPLPVNMDYSKNPRYLGQSAWRVLREALEYSAGQTGPLTVFLNRQETLEVTESRTISRDVPVENVLYVKGDLTVEGGAECEREIFVTGAARAGKEVVLRTLACEGSIELGPGCRIVRWIDADGEIKVGEGCDLGANAAGGARLSLGMEVRFKRLFGNPVATAGEAGKIPEIPDPAPTPPVQREEEVKTIKDVLDWHRDSLEVGRGKSCDEALVVKEDLELGESAILRRPARVYGKTEIGAGALVLADVFSEGPITVGDGAVVLGNLFSQDAVTLGKGVRVGREGEAKSVIAKKAIRLGGGVRIHGYVLTDGQGEVAEPE